MTRTINTRRMTTARRAMLTAAMAATILGTPLTATAYDMITMAQDLNDLQAQTMPMPAFVGTVPTGENEATFRLGSLYGFIEGTSGVSGPVFVNDASNPVQISATDLMKSAKTVYNTLNARCDYWLASAAPPPPRTSTLTDMAERIEALETGAQLVGAPAPRVRASLAAVDALIAKLQTFVAGLGAANVYQPWETEPNWQFSVTLMNESMNSFYNNVNALCTSLGTTLD